MDEENDINDVFKDFKVVSHSKIANKKLMKFDISHEPRYEFFYKPIAKLYKENYFIYGLLAHFFRRNFRKDEEGILRTNYVSLEQFKDYFEKHYDEEMKCIKMKKDNQPVTIEALYKAYQKLIPGLIYRYSLFNCYNMRLA